VHQAPSIRPAYGVEGAFCQAGPRAERLLSIRKEQSLNTVTVVGNLTPDPELRFTPNGQAVAKFGLAFNRSYLNRNGERVQATDFLTVNVLGQARRARRRVAEDRRSGARGRMDAKPDLGDAGRD